MYKLGRIGVDQKKKKKTVTLRMQRPCCGMHTSLFLTPQIRSIGLVRTSCALLSLSLPPPPCLFCLFIERWILFIPNFGPATACLIPSFLVFLSQNWTIVVRGLFGSRTDISELCPTFFQSPFPPPSPLLLHFLPIVLFFFSCISVLRTESFFPKSILFLCSPSHFLLFDPAAPLPPPPSRSRWASSGLNLAWEPCSCFRY